MKNLQSKLLVALVWIALSGSSRAEFLYVSYQSSITSFFLNENTGSLALLPSSPLAIPEGVGQLVLDRTGLYLYASTKGSFITDSWGNIAGYRVSNDGSLTPLPGSPFNLTGGHLALDPFGRFLYAAADAQNGTVSVYRIRAHGALQPVPGSPFSSGSFSISITTDPFGRFVYVANFGSQDISGYRVLENGALSPVPGSPFPILGAGEPITVVVERTGRFLYAANFGAANVSSYRIGPNGALTPLPGSPTKSVGGLFQTMALDAAGGFLYAADFVQGLTSFHINNSNGTLELGPRIDTEPEPFAVGVDPHGKFVYAGNANDVTEPGPTSLSGFRIGTHGALTPVPGSPFFPPAPVPSFPISIVITSSGKAD